MEARAVWLDLAGERLQATLRGSLKRGPRRANHLVAVGDWVTIERDERDAWSISGVEARTSKVSRAAPDARGRNREHVLAANLDELLIVVAWREPETNPRVLDRLLVIGALSGLPTSIVLNKLDLADLGSLDPLEGRAGLAAAVHRVSARSGEGCEALAVALQGRTTLLAGPSGVGKSSLVNRLIPSAGIRSSAVSRATGKGVHTTSRIEWRALPGGGALLDSPGLRGIRPWGLERQTLAYAFPEMRTLPACGFRDCSHRSEPGCSVRAAAEAGAILRDRYESYLTLYADLGP